MISKKLSEMEEQQLHSNDERGRLRTENAVLTERVHVLEEQMLVAEQRFKEEAQQDIDSSSEMVEVLTQQTEELRRNGPPRQGSIVEQMSDLEESLEQARADIRDLQRERDDLQAQLLAASVERGRSLLADEPSLADELMNLEALREQEVCNQKLRVYINGILMRVIERHPEILEIGELAQIRVPSAPPTSSLSGEQREQQNSS
ncbi:FIP domain protein [Oesophagostomum dentatum]|uniref:FIP domain protein n=1 Tax=Oesophagostomum dentatum TaxID=61180 RepID=A0A0B1T7M9_OESDE|nr:FIP domain protein [Oesophagostomum dentatum]